MKTQTRRKTTEEEPDVKYQPEVARYDEVTDEDIELYLAEAEEQKPEGFWNLPTVAGLSLILFGTGYLLQELGFWTGFNLTSLAQMLPWLAGVLIILIGFGVLGWKPRSKRRQARQEARAAASGTSATATATATARPADTSRKKLRKSHNKKLFGVCGGLSEYFNLDPTVVRIAFVIATLFTSGSPIVLYLALAFILPPPEPKRLVSAATEKDDAAVYIIRDQ